MSAAEYADIDVPQGLLDVVGANTLTDQDYLTSDQAERLRLIERMGSPEAARRVTFQRWRVDEGRIRGHGPDLELLVRRALQIPARHPLAAMKEDDE